MAEVFALEGSGMPMILMMHLPSCIRAAPESLVASAMETMRRLDAS